MILAFLLIKLGLITGFAPPDKAALAAEVSRALDRLNTLSFEVDIHSEGYNLLRGQTLKDDLHLVVKMKKGAMARVDAFRKDLPVWVVTCDGKQVTEWIADGDCWTRYPLKSDFGPPGSLIKKLLRGKSSEWFHAQTFGACWLDEDSIERRNFRDFITNDATSIANGKDDSIIVSYGISESGPRGPLLERGTESGEWVFDKKTHLPARIFMRGGGGPLGFSVASMRRDIIYKKMTQNPALSADAFDFEPPAGSTFLSPDDPRFAPPPNLEGTPAPAISLLTLKGKPLSIADFRTKQPVLLVFWATWCGPCIKEVPFLNKLRSEHPEDRLAILAVSDEKDIGGLASFAKRRKVQYQIVQDPDSAAMKAYQAKSIPRSVLIDKSGKIVRIWQGWSGDEEAAEIRAEIAKLIK